MESLVRSHDSAPPSTVRSIVAEAVSEVIAAFCTDDRGRSAVVFAPSPSRSVCDTVAECVSLGPSLGVDDRLAGHVHRLASAGVADEPWVTLPLRAVVALVCANVTRDLLDLALTQARHSNEHLNLALQNSRTIGVAMGVLMATCHVDRDTAIDLLRSVSQRQNRKLRDVAAFVEFAGVVPDDEPPG